MRLVGTSRSAVRLRPRKDHSVYSPELLCCSARVLRADASDHFHVEAVETVTTTTKCLRSDDIVEAVEAILE